jgi:hypothetical protein
MVLDAISSINKAGFITLVFQKMRRLKNLGLFQ